MNLILLIFILFVVLCVVLILPIYRQMAVAGGGVDKGAGVPQLHVSDPWLYYMQTGKKTFEGRRGNDTKYASWLGKKVYFFNKDRKIPFKVTTLRHYPDLDTYLNAEGWENAMPGTKSREEVKHLYNEFYSDERIAEAGGMVAIEVDVHAFI